MTGCGVSHYRWLLNSRGLITSSTPFPVRPHPPPRKKIFSIHCVWDTSIHISSPTWGNGKAAHLCVLRLHLPLEDASKCIPNGKISAIVSKRNILGRDESWNVFLSSFFSLRLESSWGGLMSSSHWSCSSSGSAQFVEHRTSLFS